MWLVHRNSWRDRHAEVLQCRQKVPEREKSETFAREESSGQFRREARRRSSQRRSVFRIEPKVGARLLGLAFFSADLRAECGAARNRLVAFNNVTA